MKKDKLISYLSLLLAIIGTSLCLIGSYLFLLESSRGSPLAMRVNFLLFTNGILYILFAVTIRKVGK